VDAPLNATRSVSVTLQDDNGAALPPGMYYLEASSPQVKGVDKHVMVLSPYNLMLKCTSTEALVWATDLKSGQPVAGVTLAIYDRTAKRVGEVKTDANGLASATFPKQDPWSPLIVLATGDKAGAVTRNWSSGIDIWNFGLDGAYYTEAYRTYFYTDRRIYRPGQTIYFKGVVRAEDDVHYTIPQPRQNVSIVMIDSQGREVAREEIPLSEMGTFSGEFTLGNDAALGYYYFNATYDEQVFGADFQVAEYRKPEFQVSVAFDKTDALGRSEYMHGDTLKATAEATYFFGGPVANANVTWRVMHEGYNFDRWEGQGWYSFSDWEYQPFRTSWTPYGEFLTEGQGKTDANGKFTLSLPADLSEYLQSQIYTLEVSVVDVNNQEVSARSSATVHKGAFYIGLQPQQYVGVVGKDQAVDVITVDTQGLTVTKQAVEVVFNQHEWYSVQEQADDGSYYWSNQVKDTPVATQTITTDALGRAVATFTPKVGGVYKIVAKGLDANENQVRSAAYLWVSDQAYVNWGQRNDDRIELIADKKQYKPGDAAEVLIPSPYQGAVTALLTIERGHVLESKIIKLATNSARVRIPITADYAPNVYVSVFMVKGIDAQNPLASMKLGYVKLPVSTEQKELTVRLTPDKSGNYKPRDKAIYDVEVLDYQGKGVEAEVSLQLVDLAVESLVGAASSNIVETFYRERGDGVATAATLARWVDRKNLELAKEGKGGGGGGDGGPTVRTLFPDTAFWAPNVKTDASGKARVELTLPDNLTTWRMTGQAITADTLVGAAKKDIVSTLDVLIRPITPRFLVIGDQPVLGAAVHNNTSKSLELKVSLQAQGLDVTNAEQTITVPAGGVQTVSWPAVAKAVEEARLDFTVQGGSYGDAVSMRLPVYHVSTAETVGTAGVVEDRTVEMVRVPEDADKTLGELQVLLEPSLAAGMKESLRYLETYPYGCVEQTVSRFLPNVATYAALKKLGVKNAKLEAALPQQVGVALQRLYTLQNPDGGWGWWGNEASRPELTAYVLLGLSQAKEAGFVVAGSVVENAVAFLYNWLDQEPGDTRADHDERAAVLYALAVSGQGDLGRAVKLYDERDTMSLYAQAYLAMTLKTLAPDEATRPTALLNAIAKEAILSAAGTHWEETERVGWAMNTDTRSTSIILKALVQLQPSDSTLPNVVRWLMTARQGSRWETTQENVWAILALTDYMVSTGELLADYDYNLVINDAEYAAGAVSPSTVDEPIYAEVPVSELRADMDNDVAIERTAGKGMLYYSAFLRYYLPANKVQALDRGVSVYREYTLEKNPKMAVTAAAVNDVINVKLTIVAPHDLYYFVLEDPLPAGCEAIDTSLLTTSALAEGAEFTKADQAEKRDRYGYWWWNWPSHTELRDEKVALFASYLAKGVYEYTYSIRCTTPGEYSVMPATAYEMYFADVFGRSAGASLTITTK